MNNSKPRIKNDLTTKLKDMISKNIKKYNELSENLIYVRKLIYTRLRTSDDIPYFEEYTNILKKELTQLDEENISLIKQILYKNTN